MAKKLKASKLKENKEKKNKIKVKVENTSKETKTLDPRAAFYAKQLETVEKDLQLVSNSVVDPDRLSSGVLCIDYVFGGGFIGIGSLAGEEGSAKTTSVYHTLGVAKANLNLPYVGFYDAEGAISTKYSGNIWKPFGLEVKELLSKKGRSQGFYYYRDQVIERMFDYLKKALKMMPDKNWVEEANSWCYFFPKRDDHFKRLMEIMEVKPSNALSTGAFYVVPTENSKPEGLFGVDSFASLLTREEEDKEDTGSVRSAMDAAAFAKHLKRVKIDAMEKKIVILGTNHLGSHVRQQFGGPDEQQYEKMGNALKYYSDQRARLYSRASSSATKLSSFFTYDKDNSKFGIEQSVEANGSDRYAYKEIKNVKNKFGNPGLKTVFRVWVSDYRGKPRGIDPAFDVFVYLKTTNQLINAPKGKGKGYVFDLKPSIGKKKQGLLNSCKPFTFLTLKTLVIGEYTNNNSLIRKGLSEMGIDKKPNLRESLFKQLKEDDSLWSYETTESSKNDEEESEVDYEEL